ncbi:hypothetical protein RJ639_023263 [Escallonia herrerae]|uniref:Uncharacterized protein n=1 Tax=Escallonia herrerae TaxID=1293975 RepID=A0AA88V0Z1_9ASTE|nr:hypothetical protein RJ639_023263 [Escallonia herrerae]
MHTDNTIRYNAKRRHWRRTTNENELIKWRSQLQGHKIKKIETKGIAASKTSKQLIHTVPALNARDKVLAVSRLLVKTPAARPYRVAFALLITSSRSLLKGTKYEQVELGWRGSEYDRHYLNTGENSGLDIEALGAKSSTATFKSSTAFYT